MRIVLAVILIGLMPAIDTCFAADNTAPQAPGEYQAPELTGSSNLRDYLLFAMASSPALEASYNRWQSAAQAAHQAGTLPNPRISYGYFLRQVETRVGPQVQRFGISQAFPWFGKLDLARGRASAQARAAARIFEAERVELCRQVSNTWYDYWLLGRRIEITHANISLLEQAEAVVRARYTTSNAGYSQLLKVQVELGKLEDTLASLEEVATSRAAAFNYLLGRDVLLPLTFPANIDTSGIGTDMPDARQAMLDNNPELKRLRELQASAESNLRLSGKQRWPDIMLGLDYIQTDPSSIAGVSDNGKDPVIASISLELPLSFGKYYAAENQAARDLGALKFDQADLENRLEASIQESEVAMADARRKLELYGSSLVPRARQAMAAALSSLATGGSDVLDVLDAQRTLLAFELEQKNALAALARAHAELEATTGGNFNLDKATETYPGNGN